MILTFFISLGIALLNPLTAALVTTAAGIMGTYTKSNADNIKPVPTRDIEVLNNDIESW